MDWLIEFYTVTFRWLGRQLTPEHRYGRPPQQVVTLDRVRTASAIVVSSLAAWLYGGLGEVGQLLNTPMFNALLAIPALLVAAGLLLCIAQSGQRAELARSLGRPLGTAGGAVTVVIGLSASMQWYVDATSGMSLGSVLLGCCLGLPLVLILVVYVLPALIWGSFLAVRHWFRSADGHPMLPPLVALGFAAAHIIKLLIVGLDPGVPVLVGALLTVGGPACLVVTATAQLFALTEAGYSMRDLPSRVGEDSPA